MVRAPDDGCLVVELVEDEGPAFTGPEAADGGGSEDAPRRWWGRRTRRWGAVALVLLAVPAVVTTVVDRRADAERRRDLAELPWVLPRLDGPLTEAWRADADALVAVTSDVVVVRTGATVEGLDAVTGESVWSAGVDADESCGWTGEDPFEPPSDAEGLLLCEATAFDDEGVPTLVLRSIDGRSGRVLDTFEASLGSVLTRPSPSDIVLLSLDLDGTVAVARRDLRAGSTVWRHEEAVQTPEAFGSGVGAIVTGTTVSIGGPAPFVLDLTTGAETALSDERPQETRWPLADGAAVVWAGEPTRPGGSVRVEEPGGGVRFSFEGAPVLPAWQDGAGTALGARMWSGGDGPGALVALDVRSGERLWSSADSGAAQSLLQLDGRLLRLSNEAVLLDLRSGRTLWRHPVDTSTDAAAPVTDGDVVVLPVRADGLELVAVALDTGAERWRMPAPEGLHVLGSTAAPGLVLAVTDDAVVAYRPS